MKEEIFYFVETRNKKNNKTIFFLAKEYEFRSCLDTEILILSKALVLYEDDENNIFKKIDGRFALEKVSSALLRVIDLKDISQRISLTSNSMRFLTSEFLIDIEPIILKIKEE